MTIQLADDLGVRVALPAPPRRIVSLVPSITESIASVAPDRLVAVTDWCTHPGDLDQRGLRRVRGTKNPDLVAISDLAPDLVIANMEENRELDVRRLRERGIPVWVTRIEDLPGAIASLRRLLTEVLHLPEPDWLGEAARLWAGPVGPPVAAVAVAIWRDPWMVVGEPTFTSDLLRRAGLANPFAAGGRYPHLELAELDSDTIDLVLLPDEPYVFSATDGPEAFTTSTTRLISGREITWYGPSLVAAHATLARVREELIGGTDGNAAKRTMES